MARYFTYNWSGIVAELVEQTTNDPKFEGLIPALAGTRRKWQELLITIGQLKGHT
jgi:hypothetical protein